MSAPDYWPGPLLKDRDGALHELSSDQGFTLITLLQKQLETLRAERDAFTSREGYAPFYLGERVEAVKEVLDWLKPVDDDERFGEQFIRAYSRVRDQ